MNDLKKVQRRLLEMAIAIRDILEEHNIPYFITYGTLLGAVRHRGFIPWDDDFDFNIFSEYYDKAMICLKNDLPQSFFLENTDSEPLYFHAWAHVKDMNSLVECSQFPQDGIYEHKGISIDLYKAVKMEESEEQTFRINEHIAYLERKYKHGLLGTAEFNSKVNELQQSLLLAPNFADPNSINDIYVCSADINGKWHMDELFPLLKYQFEDTYFYGPNDADMFLTRCYGDYMKLPEVAHRIPHYSRVIFLDEM